MGGVNPQKAPRTIQSNTFNPKNRHVISFIYKCIFIHKYVYIDMFVYI